MAKISLSCVFCVVSPATGLFFSSLPNIHKTISSASMASEISTTFDDDASISSLTYLLDDLPSFNDFDSSLRKFNDYIDRFSNSPLLCPLEKPIEWSSDFTEKIRPTPNPSFYDTVYKLEGPCSYYKRMQTNCVAENVVEKSHKGPIHEIVYKGVHNHPKPGCKSANGFTNALNGMQLTLNEQVEPGGEGNPVRTTMEESTAAVKIQGNLDLSFSEFGLLQPQSDSRSELGDSYTIPNGHNVVGAEQYDTVEMCLEKRCTKKKLESEPRTSGTSSSHESLKQHFGTKLKDAVVSLGGEKSTTYTSLQTISTIGTSDGSSKSKYSSESIADSHSSLRSTCRKLETSLVPFYKRRKANLTIPDLNLNTFGEDGTTPDAPVQDVKMVNIKAKFRNDYLVFPLLLSSGMAGLVENVTMRLSMFNIKKEDIIIKYLDSDGDWVLIALDEDLQACMSCLGLVGQSTIKMLVEPINTQ